MIRAGATREVTVLRLPAWPSLARLITLYHVHLSPCSFSIPCVYTNITIIPSIAARYRYNT